MIFMCGFFFLQPEHVWSPSRAALSVSLELELPEEIGDGEQCRTPRRHLLDLPTGHST